MIDQDSAHHLRSDPYEVKPVLPLTAALSCKPQVGFMHQGSCLKRVVPPLAAKLVCRQPPEFVIHGSQQWFRNAHSLQNQNDTKPAPRQAHSSPRIRNCPSSPEVRDGQKYSHKEAGSADQVGKLVKGIGVALALYGRLRWAGFYEVARSDAEGLATPTQLVGDIYAVLLAFTIDELLRFSRYLNGDDAAEIRRAVKVYRTQVLDHEWPALGDGR